MRVLGMVVLALFLLDAAAHARVLEGDAIGPDNSLTNNGSGAPATYDGDENYGMPAIQVEFDPSFRAMRLDVVVFGVPSTTTGELDFGDFDYVLKVWQADDYYADLPPATTVDITSALEGVTLAEVSPDIVRPVDEFGVAGPAFPGIPTHLFTFDLDSVAALTQPIGSGSYVLAFQSDNDASTSGTLGVSGSGAVEGPLPLFSADTTAGSHVDRGILGDQDPENITLRWGINLSGRTPGDYDDDGLVTSADYDTWKAHFGETGAFPVNGINADGNGNGIVDAADYVVWRDSISAAPPAAALILSAAVPEPAAVGMMLVAMVPLMTMRRSAVRRK